MARNEDTKSIREFILVASVPDSAAKSAQTALREAGIAYEGDLTRGATGFFVRKFDVARSKDVLKADAQTHQYKITFL